jgi:hypothetical protein
MRLPVAFARVPLTIDADALAREVDALPPSAWKDHPEGAVGNTAVPLVATNGEILATTRSPARCSPPPTSLRSRTRGGSSPRSTA